MRSSTRPRSRCRDLKWFPTSKPRRTSVDLSIFFFSADGTSVAEGKYELVLECARQADELDLAAVWTPERHFDRFGGLYPNPAVLGAALAARTRRVGIRAGSVVLPLHDPIRVAEEWAIVDNISRGRVALSFASGWNQKDFTLRPEAYASRREGVERDIDCVRRLWRGESVRRRGVDGEVIDIRTYPRPIQKELSFWFTASSPPSWAKAGRLGANVLGLLGSSIPKLGQMIQEYRAARQTQGYEAGTGIVTVMLHTFVHEDLRLAEAKVRDPLMRYLRDYLAQSDSLQSANLTGAVRAHEEEFLELAFQKRFHHGSLIGPAEKCLDMLKRLSAVGVNEVACLLDFGLSASDVTEALPLLGALQRRCAQ